MSTAEVSQERRKEIRDHVKSLRDPVTHLRRYDMDRTISISQAFKAGLGPEEWDVLRHEEDRDDALFFLKLVGITAAIGTFAALYPNQSDNHPKQHNVKNRAAAVQVGGHQKGVNTTTHLTNFAHEHGINLPK